MDGQRFLARGVIFDFSNTLAVGDPAYPAIAPMFAAAGLPGLDRMDIHQYLSTDIWNGRYTRSFHAVTAEGYRDFARHVSTQGIALRLAELGLDPALADVGYAVYEGWLLGNAELAGWSFSQVAMADARDAVERLKAMGLRIGVASNWDWDIIRSVRSAGFGPDLIPDAHIASSAEGARKPLPWLFQLVCRRMGLHPWEVVVAGDNKDSDIPGGRRARMNAVHVVRDGAEPVATSAHVLAVDSLAQLPHLIVPTGSRHRQPSPVRDLHSGQSRLGPTVHRQHRQGSALKRPA